MRLLKDSAKAGNCDLLLIAAPSQSMPLMVQHCAAKSRAQSVLASCKTLASELSAKRVAPGSQGRDFNAFHSAEATTAVARSLGGRKAANLPSPPCGSLLCYRPRAHIKRE